MLLWLGGAATIAYVCRNSLGVAEKEIRNNLGLDAFQMGLVMEGRFRFRARSCKSPPCALKSAVMAQYDDSVIETVYNNKHHEGLAGAGNVLALVREFLT